VVQDRRDGLRHVAHAQRPGAEQRHGDVVGKTQFRAQHAAPCRPREPWRAERTGGLGGDAVAGGVAGGGPRDGEV
jgi:hypothetical protein